MDNRGVREGMRVRSTDGENLGKVIALQEGHFLIEKGFFFPKDYVVRYEDVSGVDGDEIVLRPTAAQLREVGDDVSGATREGNWTGSGTFAGTAASGTMGYSAASTDESRRGDAAREDTTLRADRDLDRSPADLSGEDRRLDAKEDVTVALHEEQLTAEKHMREAGEVRVRKEVKTEYKQVTVPVTKEEVHVERIPASGDVRADEATFQDGTISVPIREEEVEIRKRPVVREKVRISKTSREEERRAGAEVRSETAEIERDDDSDRSRLDRTDVEEDSTIRRTSTDLDDDSTLRRTSADDSSSLRRDLTGDMVDPGLRRADLDSDPLRRSSADVDPSVGRANADRTSINRDPTVDDPMVRRDPRSE